MQNPVEIEQRFQSLLALITYPCSARQRLQEISQFLDLLGDDLSEYESYLLELVQHLPGLISSLNAAGSSPEPLRALLDKLRGLQTQLPALGTLESLNTAIAKLKSLVASLYAYAGDLQTSLAVLDEHFVTSPPDWLPASNGNSDNSLVLVQQAHEHARRSDAQIAAALEKMIIDWSPAPKDEGDSIVVPVIERSLFSANGDTQDGGLRRVSIQILGAVPSGKDEIDMDVGVVGAQPAVVQAASVPITAGRRLLATTYPHLAKNFFTGKIKFDATHALHEGNSANLAIAALLYCAALHYTDQRLQYRLAAKVAITGDLNEKGEVLSVDREVLPVKVQAAFFSWVECLVVPKSQVMEAEAALQELTQRFPNRQLTIMGVRHLREIFYDRRLTERDCVGPARHIARKAWQKKFTVGGVAIMIGLILIVGKLLYGPLDKNPVVAEFAGESLLVKNKNGDIIDEISVGPATVRRANSFGNDNERNGLHYVTFCDIDADSINEVFWLQWGDEKTQQPGKICCKSVSEDTLRWSISLRRTLDFPRKPDVKSDHFFPNQIAAGDFDGDDQPEVFVDCTHDFFPSLVLKLGAKTGKELGCYVHVGHLPSMKLVDLDDDGITEVLLCGVNNAFRQACLVVLDPRFISGHSPLAGDYVINDCPPGLEKAYVLIPKTIVGEAFQEDSKNNIALALFVQQSSRNFYLLIRDITLFEPPLSNKLVVLFAYFGFDLKPQGFGTGDNYDIVAEKLFRERRLSRMPDYAYFEEYKKTMRYWDGEGWQNEPVLNKHYVEASKTK